MRLLQAGAAKSGNFWLYKILQQTAAHAGLPRRSFIQDHPIQPIARTWDLSHRDQAGIDMLDIEALGCYARISSVFRLPLDDLDAYVQACTHVWTHSRFCDRSFDVLPRFDKIVYIVRDPRDRALSATRFAFTPYMLRYYPHGEPNRESYLRRHFSHMIRRWTWHVYDYLRYRQQFNIHFLFYEQLLGDFRLAYRQLLDYLELELDETAVSAVEEAVTFKRMRRRNPGHVRKGRAYTWSGKLTDQQEQLVLDKAGPLLKLLGYPDRGNDDTLPALPADLSREDVEQAMGLGQPPAHEMRLGQGETADSDTAAALQFPVGDA